MGPSASRRASDCALDQPHEEIRLPLVIADGVHRHDVRMIELGRRARLRPKAGDIQRRGRCRVEQDLERHDSPQAELPGTIDHPHAAPAELFQQLAVADSCQRSTAARASSRGS